MSYETITTVSNILNSKNGPLYAGMASIVVLLKFVSPGFRAKKTRDLDPFSFSKE